MLMKPPQALADFDPVFAQLMTMAQVPLNSESVALLALEGRVLARDIFAPFALPAWPLSAMDGFAFNTCAAAQQLPIVAQIYAGDAKERLLLPNQAMRIMTGALMPQGADCVIPLEKAMLQKTERGEVLLNPRFHTADGRQSGKHIKAVGSDVRQGQRLLKKGSKLDARAIALLAAMGIAEAEVYRKLRVALFTSGNELIEPGETLRRGAVFNANRYLLQSLLQSLPIELLANPCRCDDLSQITAELQRLSAKADLILTIGGASAGDKDWLPQALQQMKAKVERFKLRMKPAKPLTFAHSAKCNIIALPGNPLAAYFSFQLFAAPFIRKASGLRHWRSVARPMPLAVDCQADAEQVLWLAVKQTAQGVLPVYGSSSQLSVLIEADGYIRLNPGATAKAGDLVAYWCLEC